MKRMMRSAIVVGLSVAMVCFNVQTAGAGLIVDAGPDQTVDEGTPVYFHGEATTDNPPILGWYWDFDDGPPPTTTSQDEVHTYMDNGLYLVRLTVQDAEPATDSDVLIVTVENVAPSVGVNEGGLLGGSFWRGGLGFLTNPWIIAGIVATAVAIPLALDDPGNDDLTTDWTVDDKSCAGPAR